MLSYLIKFRCGKHPHCTLLPISGYFCSQLKGMGNFMTFKVMPLLKMLIRATAMSFCSSFLGWKLILSNHWMKLMKLLNFQLQNVSLVFQKLLFINFTLKCPEKSRSLFRKSVTSRVSGQCDSELWITLNKDT